MRLYPARAVERAMKTQEVIFRAVSGEILWMQAAEIIVQRHATQLPHAYLSRCDNVRRTLADIERPWAEPDGSARGAF